MGLRLPLGMDGFEKIRTSHCYYVDKTKLIEELLDEEFEVNLITRPRRFGKTLMMSMLAAFFDIRMSGNRLFDGLAITENQLLCQKWMNRWPVLYLSLKDAAGHTFEDAYGLLQFTIASLCAEHSYLGESERVGTADKEIFERLLRQTGTSTDVRTSLFVLTRMLHAHYGKPVILLIDEYDVPLAKAVDYRYYDRMLSVMQSLLGMAWKTNPFLKFAVVTGCLRMAKESIFTGANNFIVNSVSEARYNRFFGFTEAEVCGLLDAAGLSDRLAELKRWYDGYLFGGVEVYCPWDVMNHVDALLRNSGEHPASYWRDTSHNGIIRSFIDLPDIDVSERFETLLAGGTVREPVAEDLTYDLVHVSEENLWSILYLTGYLTQAKGSETVGAGGKNILTLRIPNEEIKTIFADTVAKWFEDSVMKMDRSGLFAAWWNGDETTLTNTVTDILFGTISYFDYREDYYHAFVAGLFAGAGYEVASNREQGAGRADIVVKDRKKRRAILIEVKRSRAKEGMRRDCEKALEQIESRQYTKELLKGYQTVLCYGASFFEKECLIIRGNK